MENIEKAIKHFECVRNDAIVVLDSGFGTKQNESNIVYKNRKLYAELAINSLGKEMPKKPKGDYHSCPHYRCPNCNGSVKMYKKDNTYPRCAFCGQALDWGGANG